MKVCPECKYERTIQDDLLYPDYECLSCGIIFEKEKAQKALAELEREKEQVAASALHPEILPVVDLENRRQW